MTTFVGQVCGSTDRRRLNPQPSRRLWVTTGPCRRAPFHLIRRSTTNGFSLQQLLPPPGGHQELNENKLFALPVGFSVDWRPHTRANTDSDTLRGPLIRETRRRPARPRADPRRLNVPKCLRFQARQRLSK